MPSKSATCHWCSTAQTSRQLMSADLAPIAPAASATASGTGATTLGATALGSTEAGVTGANLAEESSAAAAQTALGALPGPSSLGNASGTGSETPVQATAAPLHVPLPELPDAGGEHESQDTAATVDDGNHIHRTHTNTLNLLYGMAKKAYQLPTAQHSWVESVFVVATG
jgi:hypothetical protein